MVEDKKIYEKCSVEYAEETPPRKYGFGVRHIQCMCMCGSMIALFIARGSLGVAILAMTDSSRRNVTNVEIYEWDKKTQSLILSSFFWGYMAMQIPAGILAKKYGGKPILLVSLIANGLICLITPTVASFGGWPCVCVCRIVMGLTQACLFPATHTLLGRWLPPRERTSLSGFVYGGYQIGTIVGMPVSGLLAETALGWKTIFYAVSGLMLVTAGVWYWFTASSPREHRLIRPEELEYIETELDSTHGKKARPAPWKHMLKTVPLWAIVAAHIGSNFSFTLFFVDLATYLERAMGIPLKNSAILSGLPYAGMWIGNVGASALCEKIYNKGLLSLIVCRRVFNSIALFGTAFGLVVLAFLSPEQKVAAVCILILTLTLFGFISGGLMVNHLDLSPQFAGVMFSFTNFVASIGAVSGPVITSYVLRNDPTDITRWRIVFLGTAGLVVLCNSIYVIFSSVDRQPWDSADFDQKLNAGTEELKPVLYKNQEKDQEANSHQ